MYESVVMTGIDRGLIKADILDTNEKAIAEDPPSTEMPQLV